MTTLAPMAGSNFRYNVAALSVAFAKAHGIKPAAVSRMIRGDIRFLDNYRRGRVSVTVKKYDEIIQYFYDNWPNGTPMPELKGVDYANV